MTRLSRIIGRWLLAVLRLRRVFPVRCPSCGVTWQFYNPALLEDLCPRCWAARVRKWVAAGEDVPV